ncbi:type II CAAX endopeptidase family protein [uncultured Croceitalea sp.]|uniref:CPBP family intramembrane glutamic endopeptidase n=1 Tax=uncultured Croceitalea sp. TaxID=1798908 RepID=UPI00330581D9
MYIEQGHRGNLGLWKYLLIPLGFISFMIFNYIAVLMSDEPVDEMMNRLIDMIGKNAVLAINLGFLALGLFIVLGWTKLVHPQSITSLTTSRKKIDWSRIFTSFFIWGTITTVFTLVSVYYLDPEDYINNFDATKFLILLPLAIILVPLQTSFEEYLFRGYMMQGLGIWVKNKWFPLILTSVLFGLMHIANPEIGKIGYILLIYYIGTGLFLGILTLMDEGLELALGFHAANNLFGVLLVTYDWGALQADAIFKNIAVVEGAVLSEILVPVFVIFPILLFVFSKLYRWTNWKERLFGRVLDKEEFLAIENGNPSEV